MNTIYRTVVLISAALAIGIATASAQSPMKLQASVPFPFTAGGFSQVMPAGDYQIPLESTRAVLLNSPENHRALWVANAVPMETKAGEKARVVFLCRGEHCTLREIRTGGSIGYLFPAPKRSKSDGQELAKIVVLPATLSAN